MRADGPRGGVGDGDGGEADDGGGGEGPHQHRQRAGAEEIAGVRGGSNGPGACEFEGDDEGGPGDGGGEDERQPQADQRRTDRRRERRAERSAGGSRHGSESRLGRGRAESGTRRASAVSWYSSAAKSGRRVGGVSDPGRRGLWNARRTVAGWQ